VVDAHRAGLDKIRNVRYARSVRIFAVLVNPDGGLDEVVPADVVSVRNDVVVVDRRVHFF
jgi:hypothetical protein